MHPEKVLPLKTVVMASVLLNNFIVKRASDVMTRSDKTQTNKLEWWMILKISFKGKSQCS